MQSRLPRAADGALLALTFLTILPVAPPAQRTDSATAPAFFPLVGALVGAIAGGVNAAATPLFGAGVGAILAVTALVVVTGGLHQDGLADCADGLGVRGDRERRLAVMRDPATGAYGTLALILWVVLMASAVAQLGAGDSALALIVAAATGRFGALLHARWAAPARSDGLGWAFMPSPVSVAVAGLAAAAALAAAAVAGHVAAGPVAALVAVAVPRAVSAWARRTLGGRTGDTLGAAVALTEASVMLVLVGFFAR